MINVLIIVYFNYTVLSRCIVFLSSFVFYFLIELFSCSAFKAARVLVVDSVVMGAESTGQTIVEGQQFAVGPPPPPPPPLPPPSLQLSYVDQTVPHFTQIPQMFQLYYQGE